MPASSYGIIVEGPYDVAIIREFIARICAADVQIIPRPCLGKDNLRKGLLGYLDTLRSELQGRGVEKALVIQDAGGKNPRAVEAELMQRIGKREWPFPHGVHACAIRREVETWLLADVAAVNSVARARGGREVAEVQGTLEDIEKPKERFKRLLSEAKLDYTEPVCAEIARVSRLESLRCRCPSFHTFEQLVIDC